VTTRDYTARTDSELGFVPLFFCFRLASASDTLYFFRFVKGVYLVITNKRSDDMWKAETKGIVGYVPSSYLSKPTVSAQEQVSFLLPFFSSFFLSRKLTKQ